MYYTYTALVLTTYNIIRCYITYCILYIYIYTHNTQPTLCGVPEAVKDDHGGGVTPGSGTHLVEAAGAVANRAHGPI